MMRPDVIVGRALKDVVKSFGRRVRSIEELPEGLAVVGTNGRSVYFDVMHEGRVIRWDAYENDGGRIPLRISDVVTNRSGWELRVETSLDDVL